MDFFFFLIFSSIFIVAVTKSARTANNLVAALEGSQKGSLLLCFSTCSSGREAVSSRAYPYLSIFSLNAVCNCEVAVFLQCKVGHILLWL